jgi:CubicO group peptidase (beta-lactamase class C family)
MFRKHICSLVLLLSFASIVPAQSDKVGDYVRAEMKRQRIPGLSLAIVKDGKIIWRRDMGWRTSNLTSRQVLKRSTRFVRSANSL